METLTRPHHILTVVCDEPKGPVARKVYPMPLTPENIQKFWEKARRFKTVFAGEISGDFRKFAELFMSQDENGVPRAHGLFWVVDDFVGVFYMDRMTGVDAHAHYIFFDGNHQGRRALAREMLDYAFRKFGFQRITVELPLYASETVFKFVASVGFKKEGKKRNAVFFRNQWFTVACFGILRADILGPEPHLKEAENGSHT